MLQTLESLVAPTFHFVKTANEVWVFDEYDHEIRSAESWKEVDKLKLTT
jgi:hypothetical protein